jgi:UDP-GlcNAc:undecaprenyl-phosphate GlcNAc-1-phosphate transferase
MYYQISIYLIFSVVILWLGAMASYRYELIDRPGKRKIHSKPTAYTGGILLIFIFFFALQFLDNLNYNLNLIISSSIIISLIGFIDDRFKLNAGSKLSLQIITVFYLIFIKNINLSNLGDYEYFTLELYSFSETFTLLSVLFLINSFNYFDGIDGSLSFGILSVILCLYIIVTDEKINQLMIILILPLIIFLFFNFSIMKLPKLFLGDSGSLMLGYILSFLIIYCAKYNLAHPILLAWTISLFVYEFLATNLDRLVKKRSPFKAGLDHFHYKLLKKVHYIFVVDVLIFILNFLFFLIGYIFFYYINPMSSLILFILFFFIFFYLRKKIF